MAFDSAVQVLVDEPLVVAEVEVGLAAVVGDEHLAVLEGVHRPGVDVDVGVELLHRDPQAPALEQSTERRGREALPERARHPTGDEDVLRQDAPPLESIRSTALGGSTGRPTHPTAAWSASPGDGRGSWPAAHGGPLGEQLLGVAAGRRRCPGARTASGTARRPGPRPSTVCGRGDGPLPARPACAPPVVSAKAATWGRWVTTSTWWLPAEGGQGPAHRHGRLAADPGVDLVEDQRRRVLDRASSPPSATASAPPGSPASARRRVSTSRTASMARASSPPDATLASGSSGSPGLAPSSQVTSSPAAVGADVDREAGSGHGQLAQGRLDRRPPGPGAAARRAAPSRASAAASSASGRRRSPLEGGGPVVVRLQLGDPGSGLLPEGDHLGEGVAVLAPQLGQDAAGGRRPRPAAPGRPRTPRPRRRASLATSASSACSGQEALVQRSRAAPARSSAATSAPEPVDEPVVAGQSLGHRCRRPRRSAGGVGRAAPPRRRSSSSSVGESSPAASSSATWKRSRSSSRARARASPPSAAWARGQVPHPAPGRGPRSAVVDAAAGSRGRPAGRPGAAATGGRAGRGGRRGGRRARPAAGALAIRPST